MAVRISRCNDGCRYIGHYTTKPKSEPEFLKVTAGVRIEQWLKDDIKARAALEGLK